MEQENLEQTRSKQLLNSFINVHKNLARLFQKTATQNGLSVPQFSILLTIGPYKEMTQKNLGELTFLPKSTLSQAVDGLVNEELLTRQQVEGNRREMQLTLTQKGEELINTIHKQERSIDRVFQLACETLTDEQTEELLNIHLQIVTYLEEHGTEQGECTR